MGIRHFLTLSDLSNAELKALIQRAIVLKARLKRGDHNDMFKGRTLAMLFEKSSTRTRVSFETAMAQCGGHAIFLSPRDTHLGRGEAIEDTARVLSRMVDVVMIRTFEQSMVEQFAAYASVPVINGLTDLHHPCQLLADLQTYQEVRGDIQGKTVTWIGDGNNMCHSYIEAAKLCDFRLRIACPPNYCPNTSITTAAHDWIELGHDAEAAVRDADVVVTDTWASMGQEDEHAERLAQFAAFQVNADLMRLAKSDAIFMHCLPAHRGEEVTDEVLDSSQSVAWQEAENRLHAQKALLEFLLLGGFGE